MKPINKPTVKTIQPKLLIDKGTISPGVQIRIYAYEDQFRQERKL